MDARLHDIIHELALLERTISECRDRINGIMDKIALEDTDGEDTK